MRDLYMARKENIDPLIHVWKSKTIYLLVILARVQCYVIFFPLNEGQKSHLKTKSGLIYKWYFKVWNLCSIMSVQNKKRDNVWSSWQLQRCVLAFRLGKCFIICSKCYCSTICMWEIKHKCNAQSNLWELP